MENTGQIIGTTGTQDADTDAADAWDVALGAGAVVAVVDSGMDGSHPDLAPNAWRNPGESGSGRESNGADGDGNGIVDDWRGWDFVGDDSNPVDENGHSTHIAGTIGARRGNAIGVAGVADHSPLMPLRVFNADGGGTVADAISAYAYAAAEGARVVNLSFGSGRAFRAEQDAIAALPGLLFVAAAGNGGSMASATTTTGPRCAPARTRCPTWSASRHPTTGTGCRPSRTSARARSTSGPRASTS